MSLLRSGTLVFVVAISSPLALACGDDTGSNPQGGGGQGGAGAQGGGGAAPVDPVSPLALAAVPTQTTVRASMNVARAGHTANLLADGRVLVIGGEKLNPSREMLDAVEVYDPASDTWTELAPLPEPRTNHTATLLANGLVLIVGGGKANAIGVPSGLEVVADAVLYDPLRGSAESVGPNLEARHGHAAFLLPSGKVLIAAGAGAESEIKPAQGAGNPQPFGNELSSAELFDPETRTFEPTGSLSQARYAFASARLADGRVLIAGGASYDPDPVSHDTAELYDEATGTFAAAGAFDGKDRLFSGASLLEDGRVLVFGGKQSNIAFLDDPQLFDPVSGSWSKLPDVPPARTIPIVVPTVGGGALLLGGYTCASSCGSPRDVNVWSQDGAVTPGPDTLRGRTLSTATVLADGSVLLAGGYGFDSQAYVELLSP